MTRSARFRVYCRLDSASRMQAGTVTISRCEDIFAVRPLRRRREFTLPLSAVASMVVQRVIKAEAATARAARKVKGVR